jgi:hypothetical protein
VWSVELRGQASTEPCLGEGKRLLSESLLFSFLSPMGTVATEKWIRECLFSNFIDV